ncbi:hypothetical protein [Desulfobulbus alkaliphilus]|uniref:hypothetical protein n=1 Tax=Desulfobulbus alkaliphilus TaxID=869814 RepID=UPI001962494C|nr:hypothetical protein [Desulfobulbus alkaliphilus]MBM9535453.1 hypothetical protein [Desulfobulbus alkaliphilus]
MLLEPLPRHGQGGSIIGGRRGTGQDELARRVALVNCSPDMIPDGGFNLPLIDKTRRIALQYQAGINRNCLTGIFIAIKHPPRLAEVAALAVRSGKALWFTGAEVHDHFEPYPSHDSRERGA